MIISSLFKIAYELALFFNSWTEHCIFSSIIFQTFRRNFCILYIPSTFLNRKIFSSNFWNKNRLLFEIHRISKINSCERSAINRSMFHSSIRSLMRLFLLIFHSSVYTAKWNSEQKACPVKGNLKYVWRKSVKIKESRMQSW